MFKIVQFTHPGSEHGLDRNNATHKSWNTKNHKRKFLLTDGKYQSQNALHADRLIFWGEWEPPSYVEQLTERPTDYHPQWLIDLICLRYCHSRVDIKRAIKIQIPVFLMEHLTAC